MAETGVAAGPPFAGLAAELIGADIGPGRRRDLDRAVRAAQRAAGDGPTPGELAARLRIAPAGDPARRAFVETLTISETQLFRLKDQFGAFAERVLPGLVDARRSVRRLRLWSAGCSTGEEAWSLAILLERVLPPGWDATVVGTDVDQRALEWAERGVYGAKAFRGVPEGVRARWFTPTGPAQWTVDPVLRRRVRFAPLNLVTDDYPSEAVDLLLCRNVLMYLTSGARAQVATRLVRCLAPGGWLAVAAAEVSAAEFPDLIVHRFPRAILHQRPGPAAP